MADTPSCWNLQLDCDWLSDRHFREPVVSVRHRALNDAEKLLLQRLCDRAGFTDADGDPIHGADWRKFRSGSGEQAFIRDIEHFTRYHLFDQRDAEVLCYPHDGAARDAGEHAVAERCGDECAVADEEEVFAGTFADVSVDIERNAFH